MMAQVEVGAVVVAHVESGPIVQAYGSSVAHLLCSWGVVPLTVRVVTAEESGTDSDHVGYFHNGREASTRWHDEVLARRDSGRWACFDFHTVGDVQVCRLIVA